MPTRSQGPSSAAARRGTSSPRRAARRSAATAGGDRPAATRGDLAGAVILAHPMIAVLRSASLATAAQQEIERLILAGELRPGAKLTEAALSEKLGVSRGPIREALRMLEEAGLVRQEKNRGAYVRDVPPEEAAEIYDLRAVMDELAGRRLAEHITDEQARTLRSVVEQMEQAARRSKPDDYHLLNLEFHDRMIEFTGNRKMAAIYRKLVKELSLARWRNLAQHQVLPHSAAEHRQILKSILDGDVESAGRLLYEHVMESKQRMLDLESAVPARAGVRA